MRAWVIVLLLIVIGIVGAWIGYWIGHALGWTTNAEFPLRIGAGERAILLSILVSFGSVMAGVGWFVARPLRRTQQLLANGRPGHATVRTAHRTGLSMSALGGPGKHQVAFELEMHPSEGPGYPAHGLGVLTETEEAGMSPGTEVAVRFDPAHPTSIAVVGPYVPAAA